MYTKQIYSELQDAYLNNELIPVIGSGISLPFGLPDWKTLLLEAAEYFEIAGTQIEKMRLYLGEYDYLSATDMLLEAGVTESGLKNFVAERMKEAKKQVNTEAIENNYVDLAGLSYARFMTTNYDEYLNDFLGTGSIRLSELEQIPVNEFSRARYRQIVIPIHGEISEPESIVLSRSSYEKLYSADAFEHGFQHLREKFTFLFMGFSFDDEYVQSMFKQIIGRFRFRAVHYILFDESEKADREKLRRLYTEYNVKAIFYDRNRLGHTGEIREILDNIAHFRDADIDLQELERLQERKSVETDEAVKALLEAGKKAREEERLSEVYEIYHGLEERNDFSRLKQETQMEILCSMLWYHGTIRDFESALQYMERIHADELLVEYEERAVLLYAQILWNVYRWDDALEVLQHYSKKDKIIPGLLYDIVKFHKEFLKGKENENGTIPIYGPDKWDEETARKHKESYQLFKEAYVNAETYNLKNLKQYESLENQEIAYFWLGVAAGQLFHEHADAIQYLNRALELRHAAVYCEELAFNYLALAEENIRYKANPFYYELEKNQLMKAKRCFQFAFQKEDAVLKRSVYERGDWHICGCCFC